MNSPRTILISAPYFPPHSGGLERYVSEVAHRLNKTGRWNVVVVTSCEKHVAESVTIEAGVKVYRLRASFTISNTPFSFSWFRRVRQILKVEKPDVINVHTPVPGLGDLVSFLCGTCPVVVTYHAGSMKKGSLIPDTAVWLYEHGPMRFLLKKAQHIICSSDAVRDGFLKAYAHKSSTITPGVDLEVFSPTVSTQSKVPNILFVGALGKAEQYKGVWTLIDAFAVVAAKFPNATLTIVGEGDMAPGYTARVAELGLSHAVLFTGKLLGADLVSRYQSATVFCLPSANDSSPMVITEAMAAGLPVVSTLVGGIPHIVMEGETGYLIEPQNPSLLASKLLSLLEHPDTAEAMGVAGRKRAEAAYSWDVRMEECEQVLATAIQQATTIVQVCAVYPPHHGGMEKVVEATATRLADVGYIVQVLTASERLLGYTTRSKNLVVKRLSNLTFAQIPLAPTLLFHLCRLPRKSLIHFHLSQAYWPEMVLLVAKIRRIPYIVHFHLDVQPSSILGVLFLLNKKIVWSPFLRGAAQVVVCSEEQVPLVVERYGVSPEKVTVVPNAVTDGFFTARTYTPSTDVFKILYVGRVAVQKRVERLVEAMALLTIPAHLTIVGDGECRKDLEQKVRDKGLRDKVTFLGAMNSEAVAMQHGLHDAFVISSDREGLPLVVLEALAGGLPVIGTNVTGTRELVAGVGVLVDEPYAANFAAALTNMWQTQGELARLSERSKLKATDYTWAAYDSRLRAVYKKVGV